MAIQEINAIIVFADYLADGQQIATETALRHTKQNPLGAIHHLVNVFRFLITQSCNLSSGTNEPPTDGGALYDVTIVLHVDRGGHNVDKPGDIGCPPQFFQAIVPFQLVT